MTEKKDPYLVVLPSGAELSYWKFEEQDLSAIDTIDLAFLSHDLSERSAKIRDQIESHMDEAEASAVTVDADWLRRARNARTMFNRFRNRVIEASSAKKRTAAKKRAKDKEFVSSTRAFERAFVEVAWLNLSEEIYKQLAEKARATANERLPRV